MDRNPSPPPSDDEDPAEDSIGNTIYSKHWLFNTLTKLIEVVTCANNKHDTQDGTMQTDLDEEMENEICKVWDMSMDEDVTLFLQEFNAPEILLGVIAKSKCQRLTEICVGILGNMVCFPVSSSSISNNEDLGEVLLLLLCDSDPPTLLETCRLLLTCLSQVEVANTWVERIRKRPSVCDNICFIMSSSTNVELLVKVGEVVDKLFDLDEELMLNWIKRCLAPQEQPASVDSEDDQSPAMEFVPCLLEAAKQLRSDNPEGLDVYMHILQLLTTVDEGVQAIVQSSEVGRETWSLLSDLTCNDLCQADDPPLILQEQKTVLSSVLAVMSVMFSSQIDQEYMKIETNIPLISSLVQILEHMEACQKMTVEVLELSKTEETNNEKSVIYEEDFHLKILKDICVEFLSNILILLTKENILEALKHGHLSERKLSCAIQNLLPLYYTAVVSFVTVLHEADQKLAKALEINCPSLRDHT
ncbi:protein SAAL1 isoform X2 [Ambystoma mexicanum]